MRLPRLFRTSTFQFTLLYAALTSVCFLLLFGVALFSVTRYAQTQLDITVSNEIAEIEADTLLAGAQTPADAAAQRRKIVQEMTQNSPGFFYLLQDASGKVLAGNLPAMPAQAGIYEWRSPVADASDPAHRHHDHVRGRGVLLSDGSFLFVGLSARELHKIKDRIWHTFFWGIGATLALTLGAGMLMSFGVLRRIESISKAGRDIVEKDLQRRIPVRGSGDEFDHLAISINTMLERIQNLLEGLQQVSTDIAHDLRTPLTRLRQRLEHVQRHPPNPETFDQVIAATQRDIDTILGTFGALLRIAQIEHGARKAGFSKVDLSETLKTTLEVYQPAAEEKQQLLEQAIANDLFVTGDRDLLIQLFANLLENAVRHAPPAARIQLRAERVNAGIIVSVTDNGPGIPRELLHKVIQPFFRLEASRTTPGNGLGLSLAAAIATLHDTKLALENATPGLRAWVLFKPIA